MGLADRCHPNFEVAIVSHKLGCRLIGAVPRHGCVARRANHNGAAVALCLNLFGAGITQRNIEARAAIKNR